MCMYFISVLAVVAVSGLMLTWGLRGNPAWFIDMPSFLIILIFAVTMLLSTGLLRDFNNAFRLIVRKNAESSVREVRRAIEAVSLTRKVMLAAGGFTVCFSFVLILGGLDDPAALGPSLAVCILTMLYALAFVLILLPLESGLRLKLQDMPQSPQA